MNEGPILLHYVLRVSVYDTASRNTVTFQIAAYFKNGRRWINFPTLSLHTAVFITGHVFGVTKDNLIRLAVLIEDVHFLPVSGRSSSGNPGSGGGGGKRKESDRWGRRVGMGTGSKRARIDAPSTSSSKTASGNGESSSAG